MADIFISYASEDRDRIGPIVKALQDQGWSLFWDWTSIPVGKTWRQFIREGLKEAKCVLVLWSEKSIDSEWVIAEADHGRGKKVLIPELLDDVIPPMGFGEIQAARLIDWKGQSSHAGFQQLILALTGLLKSIKPLPELKEMASTETIIKEVVEDVTKLEKTYRFKPKTIIEMIDLNRPPIKIAIMIGLALVLIAGTLFFFWQERKRSKIDVLEHEAERTRIVREMWNARSNDIHTYLNSLEDFIQTLSNYPDAVTDEDDLSDTDVNQYLLIRKNLSETVNLLDAVTN